MAPTEMISEKSIECDVTASLNGGKRAYVTFLAGNLDYWMGVVGLAKGLRKVKSAYPLVVAILPDVPDDHREILRAQGCIVREIVPVHPPENQAGYAMAYYVINYSKLRIWEFVEYEKMIYLDGNIQVFSNIDHLFDTPSGYLYAVNDCFCEGTWSKTPQSRSVTANSHRKRCRGRLKVTVHHHRCTSTPRQLQANPFDIQPRTSYMLWRHPECVDLDEIKVVHYCAKGSKPWRYTGDEEHMDREDIKMLVKKWWDIYQDSSLDYKNYVKNEPKLNSIIIDSLASKESGAVTSLAPSAA
ncbi:unnamed protein product [Arabis nemorensis]|uniref:Hexosyltransferase n=1 Tax=Arabis nemorensis TaxID=586526 RepID=A0A565BN73_9BRAS|nr:unnamed protein product [Arabis nemorensis]